MESLIDKEERESFIIQRKQVTPRGFPGLGWDAINFMERLQEAVIYIGLMGLV